MHYAKLSLVARLRSSRCRHTLCLHYHLVFSTKNRVANLKAQWRPDFYTYAGGIINRLEGVPQSINGVEDHVHFLIGLTTKRCIADFVRELKKGATEWIRTRSQNDRFHWQDGYSIFTVGAPDRDRVKTYIEGQVRHHRSQPYIDELKALLRRAEIAYDPKYLE